MRSFLLVALLLAVLANTAHADPVSNKELEDAGAACPTPHVVYSEDHTNYSWEYPAGYEACADIRKAVSALYERQAMEKLRADQKLIDRVGRQLRAAGGRQ